MNLLSTCLPGALAAVALALSVACSGSQTRETPRPAPLPASEPASDPSPGPATAEPGPTPAPAPSPMPPPRAEPATPPDRMPTKVGDVHDFPPGTPDGILRQALHCAIDIVEESSAFACYAQLNVMSNRDTDIALTHLRSYQWKVFRQRAASYVMATSPFTIRVTRRDPESGDAKQVKVFLFSKARDFPAPITLQKDGSRWWIYSNSL